MPNTPAWEKFEHYIQDLLKLDSTVCSGNQWHDVGDAVSRGHYTEEPFRFVADCKHTEQKGFRLDLKFLNRWVMKGLELGRIFILPIRFFDSETRKNFDYVVLPLDDFHMLVDMAKLNQHK